MKAFFQYKVYDQHGSYGSGGWSRNAKHRPLPRVVEGWCECQFYKPNGLLTLDTEQTLGTTKRKLNILLEDGRQRTDYPDIVPAWWQDPVLVADMFAEQTLSDSVTKPNQPTAPQAQKESEA